MYLCPLCLESVTLTPFVVRTESQPWSPQVRAPRRIRYTPEMEELGQKRWASADALYSRLRDCLPLIIFLRNRLKYALNAREVKQIVMQRLVKVDGKVRTDPTYPAGYMDGEQLRKGTTQYLANLRVTVITIEKTGENFRLVYDTKGRYAIHRITGEEAAYKLYLLCSDSPKRLGSC